MTLANAVPDPRMGVEAGFAAVPGTVLSDGAIERPNDADALPQFHAWLNPGDLLGAAQGLGLGLRWVGGSILEPMLRYRMWLGDHNRWAAMLVVYGSTARAWDTGARYEMTRRGGELNADLRITPSHAWIELHAMAGLSVTWLNANGSYCMDEQSGYGRDCDMEDAREVPVEASINTSATTWFAGLHVDFARGIALFHGIRLGVVIARGERTVFRHATLGVPRPWFNVGIQASVGATNREDPRCGPECPAHPPHIALFQRLRGQCCCHFAIDPNARRGDGDAITMVPPVVHTDPVLGTHLACFQVDIFRAPTIGVVQVQRR